jgi:hypothetical protein
MRNGFQVGLGIGNAAIFGAAAAARNGAATKRGARGANRLTASLTPWLLHQIVWQPVLIDNYLQ